MHIFALNQTFLNHIVAYLHSSTKLEMDPQMDQAVSASELCTVSYSFLHHQHLTSLDDVH